MAKFTPASTPNVTAIDVVDLRAVNPNRVDQYMTAAADVPTFHCNDQTSQLVASLWRKLPPGESVRCHTPPIGLRFYDGDRMIVEASICWQCENIFGFANGEPFDYLFDPKSLEATELFDTLRSVVGSNVLGVG